MVNIRAAPSIPTAPGRLRRQGVRKVLVKSQGLKYLAKTFTLPDVQVGGIIEYCFTHDFRKSTSSSIRTGFSVTISSPRREIFPETVQRQLCPDACAGPGTAYLQGRPKEGPDHIIRLEVATFPPFSWRTSCRQSMS